MINLTRKVAIIKRIGSCQQPLVSMLTNINLHEAYKLYTDMLFFFAVKMYLPQIHFDWEDGKWIEKTIHSILRRLSDTPNRCHYIY